MDFASTCGFPPAGRGNPADQDWQIGKSRGTGCQGAAGVRYSAEPAPWQPAARGKCENCFSAHPLRTALGAGFGGGQLLDLALDCGDQLHNVVAVADPWEPRAGNRPRPRGPVLPRLMLLAEKTAACVEMGLGKNWVTKYQLWHTRIGPCLFCHNWYGVSRFPSTFPPRENGTIRYVLGGPRLCSCPALRPRWDRRIPSSTWCR